MVQIPIKTDAEIEVMRQAGQITALVLDKVCAAVEAGISTYDLDQIARTETLRLDARPAELGYRGYPGAICISINEELVHGIPSKKRILKSGDIVSLDFVADYRGYMGDSTRTVAVGEITEAEKNLLKWTEEALYVGILEAREGNRVGNISHAIETFAQSHGLSVYRGLTGHGIGKNMHEPPQVPNYGPAASGHRLRAGMTLAIEPMLGLGGIDLYVDEKDGWTIRTVDGTKSAHFEHTILITKDEPEVLTKVKK